MVEDGLVFLKLGGLQRFTNGLAFFLQKQLCLIELCGLPLVYLFLPSGYIVNFSGNLLDTSPDTCVVCY